MASHDERLAFIAEWYDPNAALIRKYQFLFYPKDNTIEMYDIKNKRMFLKRSVYEGLRTKDLYIGSIVNVHSRQLTLVDYADQYTRRSLESKMSKTLALIKPDAVKYAGEIIDTIEEHGFVICHLKTILLSREEAIEFYQEHQGKSFFENLLDFMTSGPIVALELMSDSAVQKWRKLLGPTNTQTAKKESPSSIRARFGTDATRNACHGSDSSMSADREISFFFGSKSRRGTARLEDCTLGLVKPHAVADGIAGQLIKTITNAGFEISAMEMFRLDKANAEEFHEVYKGVVTEYGAMVDELCSGSCVAMEINCSTAPSVFRDCVGPSDPEIARHLKPKSLRALFGSDKVKNAIHCTDLPEDGPLEVEYFFRILSN